MLEDQAENSSEYGKEKEYRPESSSAETEGVKRDEIPEKQLRQLKDLFDAGVLTEEEFKEKKKKLLNL